MVDGRFSMPPATTLSNAVAFVVNILPATPLRVAPLTPRLLII